jgi:hypothetical protein
MNPKYKTEVTPEQPIYYFLVGKTMVLGPFKTEELAEKRRQMILYKEDWKVLPDWQG